MSEGRRLAEFSLAVRESTVKRLKAVPDGFECWRPVPNTMSFADLAVHIAEADRWLFEKLDNHNLTAMVGNASRIRTMTRAKFNTLLANLDKLGKTRARIFGCLDESHLLEELADERFEGNVSVWWVIVRGNLDHETHHRGQIATYLRLVPEA